MTTNSGNYNSGHYNSGNYNSGDYNSGDYSSGHYNSGYRNSGDCNSGYRNSGDYNSGYRNSGNYNSGNYNSGNYNSGDCNSGYRNSGYRNSGDYNSGHYNSGNYNSGHYNSGDYNSGYRNSGNRNSGDCNTNSPKVRLFNKDSDWEYLCEKHLYFRRILSNLQKPLCEWVSECNMADQEKEDNPHYKTTQGYLKVNKEMRNDVEISKEDREFLLSVPNFNNEILKECTGIDINNEKVKIVIDGKEIWISRESAMELKNSL